MQLMEGTFKSFPHASFFDQFFWLLPSLGFKQICTPDLLLTGLPFESRSSIYFPQRVCLFSPKDPLQHYELLRGTPGLEKHNLNVFLS